MIAALAWKEYREQRGLWLAIAILALLLSINIGLLAKGGFAGAQHDVFVRETILGLLFALMVAQGVVCGAQLVAGEKDTGTLTFLDILSGERSRLWRTKLLVGGLSTLVQALVLFAIAWFLQMADGAKLLWLIAVGWQSLVWGMVGGAVCEHIFRAILLGIGLAVANGLLLFMVPSGREAAQIALALGALAYSYRNFCATDADRRLSGEQRQRKHQRRYPNSWRTLIWLENKQGRWLLWPGLILSLIGGLVFSRDLDFIWPAATLVIGLLCGLAAFAPEQAGEQERFLGGQRLPPGRVWLVKTLYWALVAAAMAGLFCYALLINSGQVAVRMEKLVFQGVFFPDLNLRLFLTEWALYGFACGQLCALLSRKIVVTGALAIGLSILLLAFWLPSLLFGGVMAWQMLTIPFLLLATARLSMWLWFSGTLYTRRHFYLLAGCALAVVLWLGANLWYRAVEIPDVGEPFDVRAFNATLQQAAQSDANFLLRRGLELLEVQRKTVKDKLGRPTKPLFPLSPQQEWLPQYLNSGDYLFACQDILNQGWPSPDEEMGRWLDAMFVGEWAKSFEDAATKPLGLVLDPRTFHWMEVEKDGKRQLESSVKFRDFSSAGLLFAVRAMQLEARGQDRAALGCLQTLFGLSRQVGHCTPNSMGIRVITFESSAWRAFDQCVLKIGPKAEVLREALEIVQRHEKEAPDPLNGIKADYIISRNYPTHLWGHWTDGGPHHYLLKWALEAPWERERQTRFMNAVYQGQLRVATLTRKELDERRQKPESRNLRMADTFGLTLTDSNWSPEQWGQLLGSVSIYFEWPWHRAIDYRAYFRVHMRLVWLALMLYQIEEGKAAAKLEDLTPRYLTSVPLDSRRDEPFTYKVSQGEEIEGYFPAGKSPRQDRLLPGQGVLWLDAPLEEERIWYPVPMWRKQ